MCCGLDGLGEADWLAGWKHPDGSPPPPRRARQTAGARQRPSSIPELAVSSHPLPLSYPRQCAVDKPYTATIFTNFPPGAHMLLYHNSYHTEIINYFGKSDLNV